MDIKIGISTSPMFFYPSPIFKLAHECGVGVELVALKWHSVKYVNRMIKKYPRAELLGTHAAFYRTNSQYYEVIFGRESGWLERIFHTVFLSIVGNVKNNPAMAIAKHFNCYLNFHPISFVPNNAYSIVENPAMISGPDMDSLATKKFAREHGVPTNFDTSHASEFNKDIIEAFEIMDPAVMHLSDSVPGKNMHLPLGDGWLPLKELLRAVTARGKDIMIIVELHPTKNISADIKKSLAFIDQWL